MKDRTESRINENRKKLNKPLPKKTFEFKFSSITKTSYLSYCELIDLYFEFKDLQFCCLFFDKENPNIDINKYFKTTWDAFISYSKLLIRKNVKGDDRICIIADYLQKPNDSIKYYETEVKKLNCIYNTCMLESHASLFIQLVDVLLGCIVHDFYAFRAKRQKVDKYKKEVCEYFKKKLGVKTLRNFTTKKKPNYFSIWEFNPK